MSERKIKSTYEKFVEALTPEERLDYEKGYRELLISEMLIAAMQKDEVSVRELAARAGVSPTTVQNLRSGASDSAVRSLFEVFKALGYAIVAEKDDERFCLSAPYSDSAK